MAQNSSRRHWSCKEVDEKLQEVMIAVHTNVVETAARYGRPNDYVFGANVAGFLKVAEAMNAQGVV